MSKQTNFSFSNTEVLEATDPIVDLGLATNYGVITHTSNKVVLTNTTCPRDSQEIIILTHNPEMPRVNMEKNTKYPYPVQTGSQFTVCIQDYLTTTSTEDPTYRVDAPVSVKISVSASHAADEEYIDQLIGRARAVLKHKDGTSRTGELMRGILEPRED